MSVKRLPCGFNEPADCKRLEHSLKQDNTMNMYRVAGIAFTAALALFLVSVLVKLLLVAGATALVVGVVGRRLMGRSFGRLNRGRWQSAEPISIDNPAYRSPMNRASYDRIIPIG